VSRHAPLDTTEVYRIKPAVSNDIWSVVYVSKNIIFMTIHFLEIFYKCTFELLVELWLG